MVFLNLKLLISQSVFRGCFADVRKLTGQAASVQLATLAGQLLVRPPHTLQGATVAMQVPGGTGEGLGLGDGLGLGEGLGLKRLRYTAAAAAAAAVAAAAGECSSEAVKCYKCNAGAWGHWEGLGLGDGLGGGLGLKLSAFRCIAAAVAAECSAGVLTRLTAFVALYTGCLSGRMIACALALHTT
jgi:hypothetical protein